MQPRRQRLVLCLDGTWNTRESGTNVYHLSNLVVEGPVGTDEPRWEQRVYYDEGVGTGVLDSVTGGAFGIGLSRNVREAYDWLVEHHEDGDEVYVFGFSRGAFTARSLIGLIGKCGLLRRGAPIPPDEIWKGYQILGRHGNPSQDTQPMRNLRERLFGRPPRIFRSIWSLYREGWEPHALPPVSPPANRAEELLSRWSRRIPIRCVGVFDTVGSMGLDALAIPWLRDRAALFHDTHLSAIIENGFHALALDEHRANFSHIPWHAQAEHAGGTTLLGGRVEQRWFAGAHSNVGGGYHDEVLARFPLAWMVARSAELGLCFRASEPSVLVPPAPETCVPLAARRRRKPGRDLESTGRALRDSFAEFGGGFWRHCVRAKRNYRVLGPPAEMIDGRPARSVNEVVDESVLRLQAADEACGAAPRYDPPNLWAQRPAGASPPPPHRYLDGWRAAGLLLVWLAVIGVAVWWGAPLERPWDVLAGVVAAVAALAVDWSESALNHRCALFPFDVRAEMRRAWLELLLYMRLVACAAFAVGAGLVLALLVRHALHGGPAVQTWWLLGVDWALLFLGVALAWTWAPMDAAGLGSILELKFTWTPAAVQRCLASWSGSPSGGERPLLAAVERCLWRERLALIPAAVLVFFPGAWLALSLVFERTEATGAWSLLALTGPWWRISAAATLACAAAGYVEAALQMRLVRGARSAAGVLAAQVAGWSRLVLFIVLLALTVGAMVWLAALELWSGAHGPLRLAGLMLALFVLFGTVVDFVARLRDTRGRRRVA